MHRLRELIHEIHRRSLWQVLGIYVLGSWVVLQVVGELTDATSLPEWFPTLAVGLLLVGLPVVMATAFVQEGVSGASQGEPIGEAEVGPFRSAAPATRGGRLLTWRNAVSGGVLAFALLGVVGLVWVVLGRAMPSAASADPDHSVAVLPFVNMSGDADNEYFSDGIAEELRNALAQIPELRVPARTTSFLYKDREVPITAIADELDVANVLEGSVRRDGDRVRITAQLIDGVTGTEVWSRTYERRLVDVFAVQREIATDVVTELRVELGGDAPILAGGDPTRSRPAHDLYLRGRYELNRRNIAEAIDYFEQAIAEDPEYAEAHGGLALAGVFASSYGVFRPGLVDRALASADRALALDSTLSEPHTARANLPDRIGGLRVAESELRTALRLDPQDANAHQLLARALMGLGHPEESIESATRAILIDPSNVAHHWTRGMLYMTRGDFAAAETDLREALRLEPENRYAPGLLVSTLSLAGRLDEMEGLASPDQVRTLRLLADPSTRAEGIDRLRRGEGAPNGTQAMMMIAAAFGALDVAMESAERVFADATATNRGFVPYIIARSTIVDPLRANPRFQAIMRDMGVEP